MPRREKFAARERKAQQRVEGCRAKVQQYQEARSALLRESRTKLAACSTPKQREKIQISYQKKLERAEYKLAIAQERLQKAAHALGKVRAESRVAREKRDWNLTTSLKSYIDPRVLYHWGRHVEYDVLHKYYPKNLQRKFSWVQHADETAQEDQPLQKMDEEQHSTPDGIRRA